MSFCGLAGRVSGLWRKRRRLVVKLAPLLPDQMEYLNKMLASCLRPGDPRGETIIKGHNPNERKS